MKRLFGVLLFLLLATSVFAGVWIGDVGVLQEQSSKPTTPSSGELNFYVLTDSIPYFENDAGDTYPLVLSALGTSPLTLTFTKNYLTGSITKGTLAGTSPIVVTGGTDKLLSDTATISITSANLSGTTNQINLSASGTGVLLGSTNITLSLPQDIDTNADVILDSVTSDTVLADSFIVGSYILDTNEFQYLDGQNQTVATTSSPTFTNITDSGLTNGRVTFAGASGLLSDSSKFTYSTTTNTLTLNTGQFSCMGTTGAAGTDATDVLALTGGAGGAGTAVLAGGKGSNISVIAGAGGVGYSGMTFTAGGNGGDFSISTGAGGNGGGPSNGGTGGDFTIASGKGGNSGSSTAGRGGNLSFTAGLGGTSGGAVGGKGGSVAFTGGTGGSAAGTGAAGGDITLTSGTGNSAAGNAGVGGVMTMTAGTGGQSGYSTGAIGGSFSLTGGTGGAGYTLHGGAGGSAAFAGGAGGNANTSATPGVNANGGAGGSLYMYGGIGGAKSGTGTVGADGNLLLGVKSDGTVIGAIGLGTNSPVSGDGYVTLGTDYRFHFRDSAIYLASLDDGHLDLTADVSIDLNAKTLVDHIGELTGGHNVVFDNTVDIPYLIVDGIEADTILTEEIEADTATIKETIIFQNESLPPDTWYLGFDEDEDRVLDLQGKEFIVENVDTFRFTSGDDDDGANILNISSAGLLLLTDGSAIDSFADLHVIEDLDNADTGFLKKTAQETWELDASEYSLSSHNHSGVYEPVLGNPASDGYVLSSTAEGVRSWIEVSGTGDMTKAVYDVNEDDKVDSGAIDMELIYTKTEIDNLLDAKSPVLQAGTGLDFTDTTFSLSHLGIESLADPNDNQLLGWDDTDGAAKFMDIGTGLSYDHATHTLSATGGGGTEYQAGDGLDLTDTTFSVLNDVVETDTDITLTSHNDVIVCNASDAYVITLPQASTVPGKRYLFVCPSSSGGGITIDAHGDEDIEFSDTYSVNGYDRIIMQEAGGEWFVIKYSAYPL